MMAAIIAQMTRRRRERAKKKKYENSKCMYELPPFKPHFDPNEHNKYVKRRDEFLVRDNEKRTLEGILLDKVETDYRNKINVPFTWKRLFLEILLIGFIVFVVPALILVLELFFTHFYLFSRKGPV